MNRKDLCVLTLVGPPRDNPELDPLAVLHLDNRLYMFQIKCFPYNANLTLQLYLKTIKYLHVRPLTPCHRAYKKILNGSN